MKEKFWGYYPYDNETFENLWENAVFIVDANILLNLYRYSKETQLKVIECLNEVSERIWLPYNSAQEYFNNRVDVILKQRKVYDELVAEFNFNKLKNSINSIRHLTLDKEAILNVVEKCEKEINDIINSDSQKDANFLEKDTVLDNILLLFDNKIGKKLDEQNINELKKVIDDRYDKKIPPGFEDAKKQKTGRKYGDCLNWFEIIEYSKNNNKDVIYITDDNKSDWIYEIQRKKMGPRPELLNEFYRETQGKVIYIYKTDTFLEQFNKYLKTNTQVSEGVLDEIKSISLYSSIEQSELEKSNYICFDKNNIEIVEEGDVFLADLNGDNKTIFKGKRPVVIIRKYADINNNCLLVVAPLTTSIKKNLSTHVKLLTREDGVCKDSVVLVEQQIVITKEKLIFKIMHLADDKIMEIERALNILKE